MATKIMNVKDLKDSLEEIPEDTPVYVSTGLAYQDLVSVDYQEEDGLIYPRGVYLDTMVLLK